MPVPPISFNTQHPCGPLGLMFSLAKWGQDSDGCFQNSSRSVGCRREKGCISGFGRHLACCPSQHAPLKSQLEGWGERFLLQAWSQVFTPPLSFSADPDDQYKLTEDTRQLGLVVCRGTSVVLICPQDGMEAIPNPFIQQQEA